MSGLTRQPSIAQHELALPVIAEAPRLEDAGKADFSYRGGQLLLAVDRGVRRNRYSQHR